MCCTELLNKSDDLSQSLGDLLIYFGCYSWCIPEAFNKNADCCSVIIKSTLLCCCFEVMDVGSQGLLCFCCFLINLEVKVWIFALQSFNLRMPLVSSQHFPVWVVLLMSVQVRSSDLVSVRHVQVSVRDFSSGLYIDEPFSQLWRVLLIKCGDILKHGCHEIGFPLCCLQGVCVHLHVLCTGSLLEWGLVGSALVRCCS